MDKMARKCVKSHNIGQRIFEIINYTFATIFIFSCIISYWITQELPRKERIEARASSLLSFVTLIDLNMSISDLNEVIKLGRNYQYPNGVVSTIIKIAHTNNVLLYETYSNSTAYIYNNQFNTKEIYSSYFKNNKYAHKIYKIRLNYLYSLYEYHYIIKGVGPKNTDLEVIIVFNDSKFEKSDFIKYLIVIIGLALFLGLIVLLLRDVISKLLKPLRGLVLHLQKGVQSTSEKAEIFQVPEEVAENSLEVQKVVQEYNNLLLNNKNLYAKLLINETNQELGKLSSQVAHDIRSPLAALISSSKTWLHLLPEEERIAVRSQIQRIQDIANDLLRKRKILQKNHPLNEIINGLSPELLSSCIEEIVTEKRITYRQYFDLHIEAVVDHTYGIFANIVPIEFKRLLSNLINNAIESYSDKKGVIKISLDEDSSNAFVKIIDQGKGIPLDFLTQLNLFGINENKDLHNLFGNGLGIAHASQTIKNWNGTFKIESNVGKGTTVTIALPKTSPPAWFVSKIELFHTMLIIILDDDQVIHQAWEKRINTVLNDQKQPTDIKIVHFSTPDDFIKWKEKSDKESKNNQNILYLFDQELYGHKTTGLDLIKQFQLNEQTYLVTSYYEEERIRQSCLNFNIKLIPKMLVGLVPIVLKKTTLFNDVQAVLIEDNEYIRKDWARLATKAKIKFLHYDNPNQFLSIAGMLSKENCKIYIDRELGEEWPKGEEIALHLHQKGFKQLYLATGYDREMFEHLPWLSCIGKDCPWSDDVAEGL